MGELRRGFKAEAERLAVAVREGLGLDQTDRFDCLDLASDLGVPVLSLAAMADWGASPASVTHLSRAGTEFSALTICAGTARLIVYNPNHPPGRQANSLAHELSHILLEHPATPAMDESGCRRWNGVCEAEADWLAGCLLVPREGALRILLQTHSPATCAAHFGVSQRLFEWRINQTGVMRQLTFLGTQRTRTRTVGK